MKKQKLDHLYDLMKKGEKKLSKAELESIKKLALEISNEEKASYELPMPKTLSGMIELKLFENKIKQKELAKRLQISDTKLSMILQEKQRPDIKFLKGIRDILKIDADFILDHA